MTEQFPGLSQSIEAALSEEKDEALIAEILAELSGSLSSNQIENLKEASRNLLVQLKEKEGDPTNQRLLGVLERSFWLAHILEGTVPPASILSKAKDKESFKKFKKEFLIALKKTNEKNSETLKRIAGAKAGNLEDIKWLEQRLDSRSLQNFIKEHETSGERKLARNLKDILKKVGNQAEPLSPPIPPAEPNRDSTTVSQRATELFKQSCVGCHVKFGILIKDFQEAANQIESGEMPKKENPPKPPLTEEEKALLIEYFRNDESKEALIELTK